jgi:hypothetical protein
MASLASYQDVINSKTDIPNSITPESSSKLMEMNISKRMITPVNANSCGENGFLQFQLGTGPASGFLEPGTLVFYFTLTMSGTTNAADPCASGFPTGSMSSVIDRITVSVGSTVVEQVQNYNVFNAIMLSHATNNDFVHQDCSITEGCSRSYVAAANVATATIMVPLNCGILNTEKALPLFLLSGGVNINIQFNSAAKSLYNGTGGGAVIGSFAISNPRLYYTQIDTPSVYQDLIRQGLNAGKLYSVMYHGIMGMSVAHGIGSTLSYTTGLSLSSVEAVFQTQHVATDLNASSTQKMFKKNGNTNTILYVDGNRVNPYDLDNDQLVFYHLQDSVGSWYDTHITSNCDETSFDTDMYVKGFNLRRSKASSSFSHVGTPVNQLKIEVMGATASAVDYVHVVYSAELLIDANGQIAVSR